MSGSVVVPDDGGQGEESLHDAGDDVGLGASTVAFEAELVFECVEDGLDDLPDRFEEAGPRAGLLFRSGWTKQGESPCREGFVEVVAEVVLVGCDGPAGHQGQRGRVDHVQQGLAFIGFRPGDRERER